MCGQYPDLLLAEYYKKNGCIPDPYKIKEIYTQERPDWVNYFMAMAFLAKERSHDIQTKHGCVITSKHNIVLGMGYNGFPTGSMDDQLPNTRPNKYPFVIHSELNAVLNCSVPPRFLGGGIAYVTGRCCLDCLKVLGQAHVKTIYYADRQGSKLENDKQFEIEKILIQHMGLTLIKVTPDFSFFKNIFEVS